LINNQKTSEGRINAYKIVLIRNILEIIDIVKEAYHGNLFIIKSEEESLLLNIWLSIIIESV
jgi:hypothetical protein